MYINIFRCNNIYNTSYHKNWVKTNAEVLEEDCRETRNNDNNTVVKCDYKIRYMVDDKEYVTTMYNKSVTNPISINNKKYFEVEYNPTNPYEVDFVFGKDFIMSIILFVLVM